MKKMILNRLIVTVAFIVIATMSSFAQVIGSLPAARALPADSSYIADTVSVGAVMPFMVVPDAIIAGSSLYNPSGFKWTIAGAGASLNTGALTTTPIGGAGTYYLETNVIGTFANTGNITLSTTERSSPKFSPTGGCDGNTRNLTIDVISLPSVPSLANADTAQGGCAAAAPYTVKFNFSASTVKYPAYVSYTIQAYNLSGAAIGTPQNLFYQINGSTGNIIVTQAQLDAAAGSANANGRYTVTLGKMWDRISVNATNRDVAPMFVDASALKAAILVLPTPNTGAIKHLKTF
jgi:hypothetical protein